MLPWARMPSVNPLRESSARNSQSRASAASHTRSRTPDLPTSRRLNRRDGRLMESMFEEPTHTVATSWEKDIESSMLPLDNEELFLYIHDQRLEAEAPRLLHLRDVPVRGRSIVAPRARGESVSRATAASNEQVIVIAVLLNRLGIVIAMMVMG